MDSTDLARSGMGTAQQRLHAHAHNLAELSTEGFRRSTVVQAEQAGGGTTAAWERAPAPGHARVDDLVGQPMAGHAFTAHLAVFKTRDAMAGALLDAVA
jgi:hypothetical protein